MRGVCYNGETPHSVSSSLDVLHCWVIWEVACQQIVNESNMLKESRIPLH